MKVSVPWPHSDLHPNARVHFMALARRKKAYRTGCAWEATAAGLRKIEANKLAAFYEGIPPQRRLSDGELRLIVIKDGELRRERK